MRLSREEARAFILSYQGLSGIRPLSDREGILSFVRRVGCLQYDPLNKAGRNADLVLQSRFRSYRDSHLYELLYRERALIDGWDKMMSVWPVEDWPRFARKRREFNRRYEERAAEFHDVRQEILSYLKENGTISSGDIPSTRQTGWYWAPTTVVRAVLESMYHRGELLVHHKEGTRKHYGLAEELLPREIREAPDPCPAEADYHRWYVRRRVASQGLLWNRGGDGAWLGTPMNSEERSAALSDALDRGEISEVSIEGLTRPFYLPERESNRLSGLELPKGRTAFIAPLDNLIWDRALVRELFDFDYKWEVYTPQKERKYGYYVLPVLHNDRFIGRCEPVYDRKKGVLKIENWWWEKGESLTPEIREGLTAGIEEFARFLGAGKLAVSRRKSMKEFSWVRELEI